MHGYVFYPDGGCSPQYGHGGAGIHGYRWNLALPAKGIGHTTHAATFKGYAAKAESFEFPNKEEKATINALPRELFHKWLGEESVVGTEKISNMLYRVPVEQYYDGFIPLEFGGTNNTAELFAAIHCLERVIAEENFAQAATVVIRQDSQYVVDGYNLYLGNWIDKNFVRRDGTLVGNSNLWLRLNEAALAVKALGVALIFEWVRGHGSCIGNGSADVLATAARITAKNPKAVAELDTSYRLSEVTDYWASRGEERHPMMCFRYAFFGIEEAHNERREYYLSTQGKVVDLSGKRTSDDGFSVVRCGVQRHLEDIVVKQASLPREIDYKFQVDLDNVYGSAGRYLDLYGTDFLHRALDHKRHLQTFGKELLTTELHPPYLVDRIFDNMDILSDFLESYKKPDEPTLLTTDITGDFFNYTEEEVKVKKGEEPRTKTVCTLKPEIVVGYAKHKTKGRWKETGGEVKECELTLRLGVELPDRNALKRLEEKNPKVYLLSSTLGIGSFMYAVIIEAGEDVGVWSGVNSSIRVTAKSAAKAKDETKTA